MAKTEFKYDQHSQRLSEIWMALSFAIAGVQEKGQRHAREGTVDGAISKIREAVFMLGDSLEPKPSRAELEAKVMPELTRFRDYALGGFRAGELLLNLGLVLFCTQIEIFINDLLDAVLRAEPRRFMDLFAKKSLTAKEAVEAGDYESVMKVLREKVIDEIDRQGTREKFQVSLRDKFGLIEESEVRFKFPGEARPAGNWNLDSLVRIFDQRHGIVHRGELPVKEGDYLAEVHAFFLAIETLLTINAVRKYSVRLTALSAGMASSFGRLIGVSRRVLNEFSKRTQAAVR